MDEVHTYRETSDECSPFFRGAFWGGGRELVRRCPEAAVIGGSGTVRW